MGRYRITRFVEPDCVNNIKTSKGVSLVRSRISISKVAESRVCWIIQLMTPSSYSNLPSGSVCQRYVKRNEAGRSFNHIREANITNLDWVCELYCILRGCE